MAAHAVLEGHPEIDFTKWKPPGEGDVRSPCPAINALANHGILPHDGKNITKEMAVKAMVSAINFNSTLASVFATGGVGANPDHHAHIFDLDHVDKHNWIEHDVSLSREDIAFGSNAKFDEGKFHRFIGKYGDSEATDYKKASAARYKRVLECKERHEKEGKEFTYGIKEVIMSYGETALYLNLLGHDGVAPVEWVKIFFQEERFPYAEGWRTPKTPIDQSLMNKTIFNLISANEHKGQEAVTAGLGTVEALKAVVTSFVKVPTMCTIM